MRKTLTQALLAAFCAILLAAPLEGGGVMLIGMRNAMRMYGSALTDAEAAHNYAVDKARFNLT